MKLDPTEPLYVIELGTGSGKFSFFMLKALLEMKVRCTHHRAPFTPLSGVATTRLAG